MTKTFEDRIDAALTAYNAGFESKAAQKRALDDLNRAYDAVRDQQRSEDIAAAPFQNVERDLTEAEWQQRVAYFDATDKPFDLHQVGAKHQDRFTADRWQIVERLIELRAEIKVAEIVKIDTTTTADRKAEEVRKTMTEIMERRQQQFVEGCDLHDLFDGLPVSASTHVVHGHKGAVFLRTFYYMAGKLTPLNIICAVLDAKRED